MTTAADAQRKCVCDHDEEAHDHLRRGTDCAFRRTCGCTHFQPAHARGPRELVERWWAERSR